MLYFVPTPIGNLKDITYRSVEVLRACEYILAEDTRVTRKLLSYYHIQKKVISHHAHNESKRLAEILDDLEKGMNLAVVSDAGTPGISDPGFLLARACHERKISLTCLPGPTAFVPGLVASGLPCDRFYFEGFLPHKKGRRSRLESLTSLSCTIVLYESPYRLVKLLGELQTLFGSQTPVCVAREMTKMYEEIRTEPLEQALDYWSSKTSIKGELVVIFHPQN